MYKRQGLLVRFISAFIIVYWIPINVTLQVEEDARQLECNNKIDELFAYWDNNASGFIHMDFVECTLSQYKPTPLADTVAQGN